MTTFGFQIPSLGEAGVEDVDIFDRACEFAAAAEVGGYESVWVMDHLCAPPTIGGPTTPILEPYTMLGGIAARTRRVKLGTLVSGVMFRNPALVAKMVTTLDVMSRGRAILGIGAAWYGGEHRRFGYKFPPDGERLDRLEEAVQICRAMFREDAPTFRGKYYRIREANNAPTPVQPGGPPILIGGSGERRTLRLVAQYADMCNVMGSPANVTRKLDVLRAHCDAVGRDPAEITTTRFGLLVETSNADATAEARTMFGMAMGDMFAERCIVGERDHVMREVEQLVATGIDTLIFVMPLSTPDTVAGVGEQLVREFG